VDYVQGKLFSREDEQRLRRSSDGRPRRSNSRQFSTPASHFSGRSPFPVADPDHKPIQPAMFGGPRLPFPSPYSTFPRSPYAPNFPFSLGGSLSLPLRLFHLFLPSPFHAPFPAAKRPLKSMQRSGQRCELPLISVRDRTCVFTCLEGLLETVSLEMTT